MSAEQPTVLPWHREAAKEIYDAASVTHYPDLYAAIIARRDPHQETLRLLEDADNVLCDVSRYPIASVYPDGPCLERETHDNVCKLLIQIRAAIDAARKAQP